MDPISSPAGLAATTLEVADGVFAYVQPDGSWWINNAGFVVGPGEVVSIDTCSTERRTRAYLAAIAGVTDRPVRTIVNTHHHGDHTNGNCLVDGATIVGHEACRAAVLATPIGFADAAFEPIEWGDLSLAPPTVTFRDRLDLHLGERRIELHHVGGAAHTVDDVVAWLPDCSVLFVGDLVFNGGTPFALMGSVAGWLAALDWLRGFEASVVVPGHGPVGGPEMFEPVGAYLRFVQALAAAGRESGITPLEAAQATDLGPFADLTDPERLAGNLHRAYAELDGQPLGSSIDMLAAITDMIELNGGPMHTLV
jgi:cyclase